MLTWSKEIIIDANIETIWNLFEVDNIQRIMPQVIEHKVIEGRIGEVGTKYRQKYQEGKRIETYIVEDLEHEDLPDKKHHRIGFVLAKMFEIEAAYTLVKIDEETTSFVYSGQNKGLNFVSKTLLIIGGMKNNEKIVLEFMERVENEALQDKTKFS